MEPEPIAYIYKLGTPDELTMRPADITIVRPTAEPEPALQATPELWAERYLPEMQLTPWQRQALHTPGAYVAALRRHIRHPG